MKLKKSIFFSLIILVASCATQKHSAHNIEGTWKHEDEKLITVFFFKLENKCKFSFVPKGALDGIRPECTYKIDNNIIYVSFISQAKNPDDKMKLEYDSKSNVIRELKINEVFLNMVFKKINGL